jgi:hypothetical protein
VWTCAGGVRNSAKYVRHLQPLEILYENPTVRTCSILPCLAVGAPNPANLPFTTYEASGNRVCGINNTFSNKYSKSSHQTFRMAQVHTAPGAVREHMWISNVLLTFHPVKRYRRSYRVLLRSEECPIRLSICRCHRHSVVNIQQTRPAVLPNTPAGERGHFCRLMDFPQRQTSVLRRRVRFPCGELFILVSICLAISLEHALFHPTDPIPAIAKSQQTSHNR